MNLSFIDVWMDIDQALFSARLGSVLRHVVALENNRKLAPEAIKIQCLLRSHFARNEVKRRRNALRKKMIHQAQLCKEYWSEDDAVWFYHDHQV